MHRKIDFKIAIQMIAFLLVHFTSLNIHPLLIRISLVLAICFYEYYFLEKVISWRMKARFHWNKGVQVDVLCPDRKCPSVGPRQDSNCNFLSCPAAPPASLPLPPSPHRAVLLTSLRSWENST